MEDLKPIISITTLNVKGLDTWIKWLILLDWIKRQIANCMMPERYDLTNRF